MQRNGDGLFGYGGGAEVLVVGITKGAGSVMDSLGGK